MILVTHEPDIARYARRQVKFRDGRIIEDSSTMIRIDPGVGTDLSRPPALTTIAPVGTDLSRPPSNDIHPTWDEYGRGKSVSTEEKQVS